jgi:mono/diheme cytochrome c family protein
MKNNQIAALLFTASVAVAATFAAAPKDWRKDNRGVLLSIAQAPAKARSLHNPYEGAEDALRAGEKLYRQHCEECHGSDARGSAHAANLRAPDVQNATPGELEWLLRNGNLRSGMPSWSGLPEPRRWQIVTYLKSLR